MDNKSRPKIYVAGHNGMVGSAIVRELRKEDKYEILTRTRSELDLTSQKDVLEYFLKEKPDQVYIAAAKVGGIHLDSSPTIPNTSKPLKIVRNQQIDGTNEFVHFFGEFCQILRFQLRQRRLLPSAVTYWSW